MLLLESFAVYALLWILAPAWAIELADSRSCNPNTPPQDEHASFPRNHPRSEPDVSVQEQNWPLHGPWIVEVEVGQNDLIVSECRSHSTSDAGTHSTFKLKYNFVDHDEGGLNALVVQGVTKAHLVDMEGVLTVTADFNIYASAYSWGNDRVDQQGLPLDGAPYSPAYCGLGVDVYVLDTGIDTAHTEFSSTARTVSNIWNSYGAITANTDGNGHGTHVAGTVGGRTIGIARCANIYGMKVLSNSGSGAWSNILAAMNEVLRLHQLGARKSVINMSLGGGCNGSCQNNIIVKRVNYLAGQGVISIVAAGNEGKATRLATPAAAKYAITVGATSNTDKLATFSNWGTIVDIHAPGVGITSARTGGGYVQYSGTSMATPHVAGIIALEMHKGDVPMDGLAAVLTVTSALKCDAAVNAVTHTRARTTLSLALIPSDDGTFATC